MTSKDASAARPHPDPTTPVAGDADAAVEEEDRRVRRVELIISLVLRVGVVTILLVVVAGLVDGMVSQPAQRTSSALEQHLIGRTASFPHTFGAVFAGLGHGDPAAIVAAGLLLLVITPVLRVAVSIFTFVYQHDALFTIVTTFVLAVLIGSFFLGKAGG